MVSSRRRETLKWSDVTKAIRSSPWCSLPVAIGLLTLGFLILLLFDLTVVPVTTAVGLSWLGLVIIGPRLFAYIQQIEPQYWQTPGPPPHCCQHCGYNLTGNVSGICPECGVKA